MKTEEKAKIGSFGIGASVSEWGEISTCRLLFPWANT